MNAASFFIIAITALFAVSEHARPWSNNPLLYNTHPNVLKQLRALHQDVCDKGCDITLCFAIQGENFITKQEFQDQKNFVDLIIAILTTDQPGNFCAVQYGRTTYPISPLTFRMHKFLRKLQRVSQIVGYDTNIAGALTYAGLQMRKRVEDAKKLIILGDGLESVGFLPKRIAHRVRKNRIDISAVAVGWASYAALKEIVGGYSNKVVSIDEFFEIAEIVVDLVVGVCGFSGGSLF